MESNLSYSRMAISAGLADTALEALGTFIIGITAARILSPSELGAYALFFAGFTWFAAIPTNLIFIPFELGLLDVHHSVRLYGFGRFLRWGILAAIPAALLIPVVILVADTGEVNAGALTALTVTAGLAVLVFPLQNHMRRLFHLANRSELAAATSAVQFVVVVLSVLTLRILEFRAAAIPFGALAVAKVVSLSAAATMAIVTSRHKIKVNALSLSLKRLFIRGRWIVLQVMIQQVAGFVTASLLGRMVSFSALGYVEAARIVTRPVELLGQGVTASLGPRSMDAATTGNIPLAHHLRRTYLWILVPASSVYLLWVQFDSPINLFHDLIPVAYAAAGLITLRGLASPISGLG
ncbi:MAG: hypothetical protein U1E51_34400, partial [Candidatus Binatia bacterium]|nr:hypothetical protein [Candidatus Binatia bacterium]